MLGKCQGEALATLFSHLVFMGGVFDSGSESQLYEPFVGRSVLWSTCLWAAPISSPRHSAVYRLARLRSAAYSSAFIFTVFCFTALSLIMNVKYAFINLGKI